MNDFQQFVDERTDEIERHDVNLSHDQVEAINSLSDMLELSFADTVMVLVELQLSDLSGAYLSQFVEAQAKRN